VKGLVFKRVVSRVLLFGCFGVFILGCGTATSTVTLSTITVSPNPGSVLVGGTEQFAATGTFSDGSTQTITTQAVWASTNTVLGTVGASTGLVTAVAAGGPFQITATLGNIAGLANITVTSPPPPSTGGSIVPRYDHTATLLTNGTVLIAGGSNAGGYIASAEIYTPSNETFTGTGNLTTARYLHTATLLNTGKVLIVGGFNGTTLSSAELYDPIAGTFAATGSLATARFSHTATLLSSGKVLISGGFQSQTSGTTGPVGTAELYDPNAGTFSATGSLATARQGQTATLTAGKVLIAGGCGSSGAVGATCPIGMSELYDPNAGTFGTAGTLITPRFDHTATLLPDGTVLIAGGNNQNGPINTAELYNSSSASFTSTANMNVARVTHTATSLTTGAVLIVGGLSGTGIVSSAELYDPNAGTFSLTGSMGTSRHGHTATLLPNGAVLITGGESNIASGFLSSAELYSPTTGTFTATGQ
jgi:hypothetical protein